MTYRLAQVEYLNTLPFTEGLRASGLDAELDIRMVSPADCATMFARGEVDISLCPVGALPGLTDYRIWSRFCIGAEGPVQTVMLLSEKPLDQIDHVVLDPQSRTSNILVQILASQHWKKNWSFSMGLPAGQPHAFVMIGDKVFRQQDRFPYRYDLAEAWKAMTGLPMVFAVWIARPEVEEEMLVRLDSAFEKGLTKIRHQNGSFEAWIKEYLLERLSYGYDTRKQAAMKKYLELARPFLIGEQTNK